MQATKKPIIHINIGGKSRPVRFGWNATADFSDAAGLSLADLNELSDKTLSIRKLTIMVWAGLKDGARKEKQDFEASVEDIGDWIDEADEPVLEQIISHFMAAQTGTDAATEPAGKKTAAKKQ